MMPNPMPTCLRCGGDMQQGYIADRAYGGYDPQKWFEGDLVTGFLGGIKTDFLGRIKNLKSEPLLVRTYRCVQCGYLESYAAEPLS